jgi:hypothetical protein
MNSNQTQVKVFLNHASEDKPLVRKLYQTLKKEPWIQPWLDEEKILPGQDWNYEIDKALNEADAVIICLSKTSITKIGVVQAEIRKAEELQKRRPHGHVFMIPVLLEKCKVPDFLNQYHWVDITEPGKIEKIKKTLETLKRSKIIQDTKVDETKNTLNHEPISSVNQAKNNSRQELRKGMDARYTLESLKVLCFDLNVRFEDLPSSTLKGKIVDLINICVQHNKYELLVQTVLAEHPYIFDN